MLTKTMSQGALTGYGQPESALAVVVVVEGRKGTLTPRMGVLLLTLAMLAVGAALLHVVAR
jgi:hypothetical protein